MTRKRNVPCHGRRVAALAALFVACNLDGDVEHEGTYVFLPGSPIPDTAAFPLHELLVIEEDGLGQDSLFYDFRGDLGPLGVGVESLPRVLANDGAFSLLFEFPFSDYVPGAPDTGDGSAGAGGVEGGAGAGGSPEPDLVLEHDRATVGLRALTAADLADTGAARYTVALTTGDFALTAFFGAERRSAPLRWLRFPVPAVRAEPPPRYDAKLAPSTLTFAREDGLLLVDPGTLARPDYLVVDLFQRVQRVADERALEAVVRITIAPEIPYLASARVLESAFASLCWSKDKPLFARVTQVARDYVARASGDSAVIHRRSDSAEVPAELWLPDASTPPLRDYCDGFR
jgi:hypothetical protein